MMVSLDISRIEYNKELKYTNAAELSSANSHEVVTTAGRGNAEWWADEKQSAMI